MSTSECHQSSYQVVVLGELRPAVLAFCAQPPTLNETCGVFQVRVNDGEGVADLAAMLQAAGLVILSIRQVHESEAWAGASLSA
ncbi:MAG TPA: hypothetical protein VFG33_12740 [Kribbella sp.]|uniref:hypothetical protein n=1 Tax=Kribbella sp. TaxID=1871183 RepID=UPI002D796710|nr:hypothetical protein [Kribbella sp.]HET6294244.1 hypothetical protein [Kribbella sp.]